MLNPVSYRSRITATAAARTATAAALTLCLIAIAIAITVAPAHATDRPEKVITLTGSNATLGISDLNAQGPTPGDIRTLSLALTNAKNQPAGRAEIVQTLTRQGTSSGTAVKVVVLNLPRGLITSVGQTEFTDITDPKARPGELKERLAITGGTGAYRGASGEIRVDVLPNFASRWKIFLDQ